MQNKEKIQEDKKMAELIYVQADETLGFGDYTLDAKAKVDGFEFQGDLYKVKTYFEITKLKKNGVIVYESVPGTKVSHFKADEKEVIFVVEGKEDTQITLELEPEKEYKIFVDDVQILRPIKFIEETKTDAQFKDNIIFYGNLNLIYQLGIQK